MDWKKKKLIEPMLYFLIVLSASLPVLCNYIMIGGVIAQWTARVEEMAVSLTWGTILQPSQEVLTDSNGWQHAFHSNLWLLIPALVRRQTGNITVAYQITMAVVQLGTMGASILFFKRLFKKKATAMMGVLLYMTCPYRLYICYDRADMWEALVWMLLPLYAWSLLGIIRKKQVPKSSIFAALALAGMGYASWTFLPVVVGCTIVAAILYKDIKVLLPLLAGMVLCLPGGLPLLSYLFQRGSEDILIPIAAITSRGYSPGQLFTSFAYKDGNPGMGLGLMMGLLCFAWLVLVEGRAKPPREIKLACSASLLMAACSLQYFPWDVVQRLGLWAIKYIQMMYTPAIFFGFACFGLCVISAYAMERIGENENQAVAMGVPLITITAAVGVAVYLQNMLTYSRLPMSF